MKTCVLSSALKGICFLLESRCLSPPCVSCFSCALLWKPAGWCDPRVLISLWKTISDDDARKGKTKTQAKVVCPPPRRLKHRMSASIMDKRLNGKVHIRTWPAERFQGHSRLLIRKHELRWMREMSTDDLGFMWPERERERRSKHFAFLVNKLASRVTASWEVQWVLGKARGSLYTTCLLGRRSGVLFWSSGHLKWAMGLASGS